MDCHKWTKECIQCQKSKITRHVSTPLGQFKAPSARFEHIHIDLIYMPPSEGYRYCLTCVDRYTRWPEVFPLKDQEADTVARALYNGWICRFGTPLRITSDQGIQWESRVFKQLNQMMGITHIRTTAYHPQANGMVERLHRQLKTAIKYHEDAKWTEILPTLLLGIRAAWKEYIEATAAEMVYGEKTETASRVHDEFDKRHCHGRGLHQNAEAAVLQVTANQGDSTLRKQNVPVQVFVRREGPKGILQQPYERPYPVPKRRDKTIDILVKGEKRTVSMDRLKPAYKQKEEPAAHVPEQRLKQEAQHCPVTRAGRRVRFPVYLQVGK